jgi:hypothetical protein
LLLGAREPLRRRGGLHFDALPADSAPISFSALPPAFSSSLGMASMGSPEGAQRIPGKRVRMIPYRCRRLAGLAFFTSTCNVLAWSLDTRGSMVHETRTKIAVGKRCNGCGFCYCAGDETKSPKYATRLPGCACYKSEISRWAKDIQDAGIKPD